MGKKSFVNKSKNHKEKLTYRKGGTQDPKVGTGTKEYRAESLGGIPRWDPKLGLYDGTIIIGETFEEFTNTLNPELNWE